ncbi:MAG: hypothetical protein K8T10_03760 [Candidatus Eremiobacteraeota bacterium]|nr:hypothetical protein [Candidatus Eremiobacteraeota bacterium]
MEYAAFISNIENIDRIKNDGFPSDLIPDSWKENTLSFNRLYFGQEFCEKLIPSTNDIGKALDFAQNNNMEFTFLTPFVTEDGLEKWEKILEYMHGMKPGAEVVINDMGIFHLIRERFPDFKRVLGRLLTKQKRGPRILRMKGKVPDETIEHFQRFNADAPKLAGFYKNLGFTRIELDNTLQGISRDNETPASLYFPYIYVSTTRMCLTNQCDDRKESMRAIFPCKKECRQIHFTIEHGEIPIPVTIAGNTQFIYNDRLPESPDNLHIDRLVYEPCVPV